MAIWCDAANGSNDCDPGQYCESFVSGVGGVGRCMPPENPDVTRTGGIPWDKPWIDWKQNPEHPIYGDILPKRRFTNASGQYGEHRGYMNAAGGKDMVYSISLMGLVLIFGSLYLLNKAIDSKN